MVYEAKWMCSVELAPILDVTSPAAAQSDHIS